MSFYFILVVKLNSESSFVNFRNVWSINLILSIHSSLNRFWVCDFEILTWFLFCWSLLDINFNVRLRAAMWYSPDTTVVFADFPRWCVLVFSKLENRIQTILVWFFIIDLPFHMWPNCCHFIRGLESSLLKCKKENAWKIHILLESSSIFWWHFCDSDGFLCALYPCFWSVSF